ncbi:S-adenosyl-L-methionine-dependent methyltransferase [Cylindrobasidium torrendii FP15055 ss-10]|uniref:S-adenosyl-L-methionine-dependent methyltransferase n=1 Tax=Cylindrobasidium torrendii FP15055 ss-10 TaxID=1314674 RepID=A0A0D7BRH2_9AGAR|nr:S-adenosyl-L-methionine-dependent methyltransferase [Cylindrobasidium torrendii FP15055 ss-10]
MQRGQDTENADAPATYQDSYVGEDDAPFFRMLHGRRLNALNTTYLLPADDEEVRRSELHHRALKFVFDGRNYVGPVRQALQFGQKRRVLDLGTGGGIWAVEMADEFKRADIIGVDLAPIQPRDVPPNCEFKLSDLAQPELPYPDGYFDLIHARSIFTGIPDYIRFVSEVARLLRPGGLVILVEPDLNPAVNEPLEDIAAELDLSGWFALWETYSACLRHQGIDTSIPNRIPDIVASSGMFQDTVKRIAEVPVGFWPRDDVSLTVGQLQWMDFDLLLPALRPLFLHCGIPATKVQSLIEDAQRDLYNPEAHLITRINIVYASKNYR